MPDDNTLPGGATDTGSGTGDGSGATDPTGTSTSGDTTPQFGDDLDKWKSFSRQNEKAAKAERDRAEKLQKELDEVRRSQMSDQEKAIEEAKASARAEALAEAGANIARAEIRAAAATAGLSDEQCKTLMGGIDPKAFLTDSGEVDAQKVAAFVSGVAPTRQKLDLGQGPRGSAHGGVDMNSAIRRAAGRAPT